MHTILALFHIVRVEVSKVTDFLQITSKISPGTSLIRRIFLFISKTLIIALSVSVVFMRKLSTIRDIQGVIKLQIGVSN